MLEVALRDFGRRPFFIVFVQFFLNPLIFFEKKANHAKNIMLISRRKKISELSYSSS